jgi:hypothetical protein
VEKDFNLSARVKKRKIEIRGIEGIKEMRISRLLSPLSPRSPYPLIVFFQL